MLARGSSAGRAAWSIRTDVVSTFGPSWATGRRWGAGTGDGVGAGDDGGGVIFASLSSSSRIFRNTFAASPSTLMASVEVKWTSSQPKRWSVDLRTLRP